MPVADKDWKFICQKTDIPVLGSRIISGAIAGPIALFRTLDNEIFAVLDQCPHKGGPLSQGIVHGHTVTCPMHAWNINLPDGCAIAPDTGCARKFEVRCKDENIYLSQAQLVAR